MLILIAIDSGLPAPHRPQTHPIPVWFCRRIRRQKRRNEKVGIGTTSNQESRKHQRAVAWYIQIGFPDACSRACEDNVTLVQEILVGIRCLDGDQRVREKASMLRYVSDADVAGKFVREWNGCCIDTVVWGGERGNPPTASPPTRPGSRGGGFGR